MYRIDRLKRNLKYLRSFTETISKDKEKLSKNYILDCYKNKFEEMNKDIEELEKFIIFIQATKNKQQP